MKSIGTTLLLSATLAGIFLLSGCGTWHTTGEMQIGDTTVNNNSSKMRSGAIRGSATPVSTAKDAPPAPPRGNAAKSSSAPVPQ